MNMSNLACVAWLRMLEFAPEVEYPFFRGEEYHQSSSQLWDIRDATFAGTFLHKNDGHSLPSSEWRVRSVEEILHHLGWLKHVETVSIMG